MGTLQLDFIDYGLSLEGYPLQTNQKLFLAQEKVVAGFAKGRALVVN